MTPGNAAGKSTTPVSRARVAQRSALFGLGNALAKMPDLVLLPLYVVVLPVDEYGLVGLAAAVTLILRPTMNAGIHAAAIHFFYRAEDQDGVRVLYANLWLFSTLVSGGAYLALDHFGAALFRAFLSEVPFAPYGRIAIWTAFVGSAFLDLPAQLLRAKGRAGWFLALSAGTMFGTAVFSLVLVVGLDLGARGALLGNLAGVMVMAVPCSVLLARFVTWRVAPGIIRTALIFSLPMIPHFLSQWVMAFSDRVLIERYGELRQVGLYSAGYSIGWSLSLVRLGLSQALIPTYGSVDIGTSEGRQHLAGVVTNYYLVVALGAVVLGTIGLETVSLLMPAAYGESTAVARWIVIAALLFGLYNPGVQAMNITLGKTLAVGVVTLSGATLNVVLNVVLIPRFGYISATYSTAICYGLVSFAALWLAQWHSGTKYQWPRLVGALFLASAAVLVSGQLSMESGLARVGLSGVIGLGACLLAVGLGIVPRSTAKELIDSMQRRVAWHA